MPFKRKVHFKRKRKARRRSRRGKRHVALPKRVSMGVSMFGWRKYIGENRTQGFQTPTNKYLTAVVSAIGAPYNGGGNSGPTWSGVISAANSVFGGTQLGQPTSAAADAYAAAVLTDPNMEHYFKYWRCINNIRNVDVNPIEVTVREFECMRDASRLSGSNTNLDESWLYMFLGEYQTVLDAGSSATAGGLTTVTGDATIGAVQTGTSTVNPYVTHNLQIEPNQYRALRPYFKLRNTVVKKLNPGDELIYTYEMNDVSWKGYDQASVYISASVITYVMLKKKSKFLLVTYRGMLGRSDDIGEYAMIGYMPADIAFSTRHEALFVPVRSHGAQDRMYTSSVQDDLTTGVDTLYGPSDDVETAPAA